MKTRLSRAGKLKIPKSMRKKHGLIKGQTVQLVDYGGIITIHRVPDDPITYAAGMLKGETSLSQMIVEEHPKDW